MPPVETQVSGFVYRDVNNDSSYNPNVDIPIPGATVKAYVSGRGLAATDLTDDLGQYSLSIQPPILHPITQQVADCRLTVTLPSGVSSAEPRGGFWLLGWEWQTGRSTVKANDTYQNTHVEIPFNSSQAIYHDIAVDYLPLNYGPADYRYELWHYGPIFPGRQNVVLVHGIQMPGLLDNGYVRGASDNLFGGQSNTYSGLAKLLQDKSNILDEDFYNVWDFQYADALHDGKYYTDSSNTVYGERLAQVLKNVAQWTGTSQGATIIAHSMGGLVARCAVQLSPPADKVADKVANIIFLDSPGIFGGQFWGAWITNAISGLAPCVYEINPGSQLLWRVNSDYTVNKYTFKVLTLVAGVFGELEDPSEGHANGRLVECGPDGSVVQGSQSAFAVVKLEDHMGTMKISDTNHLSFQLIKQFLNGGAFTGSPNGKPTFTFVFTRPVKERYPKVTLPSGALIQPEQMIANTYHIGFIYYYAWTIQAEANESGTMTICWDKTHSVTATLTQSQSAIRKEVINNYNVLTPTPTLL